MFCPKCGQQQSSGEARFCSRCGFQLGVVRASLATEDALDVRHAPAPPPDRSPRKRDLTVGAAVMFLVAFAVMVATAELPPMHNARLVFLVGAWFALTVLINIGPLVRYFVGDLFPRGARGASPPQPAYDLTTKVSASARNAALPPSTAGEPVPAAAFGARRANTAEVAPPPSVTDHTTNLLG